MIKIANLFFFFGMIKGKAKRRAKSIVKREREK